MLLPGHKSSSWIFLVGSVRSSPTSAEALFTPSRRKKKAKVISLKTGVDSIFQAIFFTCSEKCKWKHFYLIDRAMHLPLGSVWIHLRDQFPTWTTKRLLIGILLFLTQAWLLELSGLRPLGGNVEIYGAKLHSQRNCFLPNCSFAKETIHLLHLVFILFKYCDYHLVFLRKEMPNFKRKQACMELFVIFDFYRHKLQVYGNWLNTMKFNDQAWFTRHVFKRQEWDLW